MVLFLAILVGVITLAIYFVKQSLSYWERRGIPHNTPKFFYGNMSEFRKTKHISEIFVDTYRKFKGTGPFAGFYFFIAKSVIVLDIELAKNILIKDFNNFDERGLFHNKRDDPLTGNLFFTDGESWRHLRHKLTPTFTSGKMKYMFATIVKEGQELIAVLEEKVPKSQTNGVVLEVNDWLSRYTADVIGSCAFGLECNSLRNPTAEFVVMGKKFFNKPRHNRLVDSFINMFPNSARKLRMRVIDQSVHEFYLGVVRDTIAYREKHAIKRNDFMDMLIELLHNKEEGLTVEEVAAQAFVFFIAGYETSSTTMGFTLYELAQHQEIQDKVRQEINEVFAKHKQEFTYECMKEMRYLDQIIDETLRLHPVVTHLIRKPHADYQTSDPKYVIEKGTLTVIPALAIHTDPEFYPEPEKFKPERFEPEEVQKRPACTWLPFGEGPRNCIGLRFGKMQTTIGLAYLLKTFKFSVAKETEIPFKVNKMSFILGTENGIRLNVVRV